MKLNRFDVKLVAIVLALLAPAAVAAQDDATVTGRVAGAIVSTEDGSPVTSARVQLAGTEIGALADMQGRYFLADVPPGTYELEIRSLGFATKTVTGLTVEPGSVTTLDVTMEPRAVEMAEITVSVGQEIGAAAALLNDQKRSRVVSDAIGAQQMSRSPDSDAARAASRMTGVTVAEGKFVYVRGLGERYSQTSLNGSPLPSPEPERSVVPLDLFPSSFLQSLTTQKTYTADQAGDFSGGSVQIETKDFPNSFTFRASVGSSVNTSSQFGGNFLSYGGGSLDFLGVDDGSRALPGAIVDELGGIGGDRLPSDPEIRERLGESFLGGDMTGFAPTAGSTPANADVGVSMGDRTELFGKPLGYFVAGTYANEYTFRDDEVERKWRASNFDPALPADRRDAANVDYRFLRGVQKVRWGGTSSLSLQLSPRHQIDLKTLYNRKSDDEARRFIGANREDLGGELVDERLRFISRQLAWGQLSGDHAVLDGHDLGWRFSVARAGRDEPGLRETIYKRPFSADPGDPYFLDNTGESARYLFSELTDDDLNGAIDYGIPFELAGGDHRLEVGGAYRARDRDFGVKRYRWEFLSGSTITSLDSALSAGSIVGDVTEPNTFALTEIVEPGDNYTADDRTAAGYATLDLQLTDRLRAVLGARVEDYSLDLATKNRAITSDLASTDVLPALNLTYRLGDDMNLRAAASRTVDRPEFRELAPFQFTEAASLRQIFGNPVLRIADIRSLDGRWEWYPAPGEVVTASVFHKRLDRPIEQVFIATAGTAYSFQNAEEGELYGAEVGLRKRLGFLGGLFETMWLEGNLAVVESEVDVRTGGIFDPTKLKRPLEGQSDYSLNLNLTYDHPEAGTRLGAYFSLSGDRVTAAGGSGVPDIVERPRPMLDLTFEQPLWTGAGLELEAGNLLDAEHLWEQSKNGITHVQRSYHEGRSFSASLSIEN